jgi:hypothetical protein
LLRFLAQAEVVAEEELAALILMEQTVVEQVVIP